MPYMMIALLLTVWALRSLQGSAEGMSSSMATFLIIFNGKFDNLAQNQADNKTYDYIQHRIVPVISPAIPGLYHILRFCRKLPCSLNGPTTEWFWTFRCVLSEDSKGVIYVTLYNFTNPSQYKPGAYNVEDLSKLKPENLQGPFPLPASFEPAGHGMYFATWPDIRHYVNGKTAIYVGSITCNANKIIIPRPADEKSTSTSYEMFLRGDKYKVPGAPDGFVSPCK